MWRGYILKLSMKCKMVISVIAGLLRTKKTNSLSFPTGKFVFLFLSSLLKADWSHSSLKCVCVAMVCVNILPII